MENKTKKSPKGKFSKKWFAFLLLVLAGGGYWSYCQYKKHLEKLAEAKVKESTRKGRMITDLKAPPVTKQAKDFQMAGDDNTHQQGGETFK